MNAPSLAADHAYYCAPAERHDTYDTWAEFADLEAGADHDRNLLFRWDWIPGDGYGAASLELFFALQGKGELRSVTVAVLAEDETAVRAYLQPRLEHLAGLWAPLSLSAAGA